MRRATLELPRMTIRNLNHLFAPGAVALIGASDRPGSLGAALRAI